MKASISLSPILLLSTQLCVAQSETNLFQLVNYIEVEEANIESFEKNMLQDRQGLAEATVREGIVTSWHFFRNLDEKADHNYLQVITLSEAQRWNSAMPMEIERVAKEVLGDEKTEILETGKSLLKDMREEWWEEKDRMWTNNPDEPFEYMMIGFMQSIPEGSKDYIKMEKEIWAPAIKHGMNQDLLTGWVLSSLQGKPAGQGYDYVAVDAFETEEEMRSVDWNGWLTSVHIDEPVHLLNARTDAVRAFIRSEYYKLIDWAGKDE